LANSDQNREVPTTCRRTRQQLSTLYDFLWSELGGICAGLAEIGVLAISGRINLRSIRMVCDSEAAVKRCNQKLTASIYHNTESDWDLLNTYHTLRDEWCRDIPTKVQWVKGHADCEGRELTRDEWLNIEADLLAD
jgi:hypothetical protein